MLKIKKKNLTKKEISNQINYKIGLSNNYSEKIIDDFLNILKDLLRNQNLNIKNFGLFKLVKKNERIGRNPKTKKEYKIKSKKTISFLASKKINSNVNSF